MYTTVLFPVDLHEATSRLESVLVFLRRLGTARILLIHVVSGEVEHARRARMRLNQVAELVTKRGFECEELLRRGSTATTITEAARAAQADLIVVPWKRKSWLQRTLVGSVTTDVVRLAELPVLVHKPLRQEELDAAGTGTPVTSTGNTDPRNHRQEQPGSTARPAVSLSERSAVTSTQGAMGAQETAAKLSGVLYATDFQATDASVAPHVHACGRLAKKLHLLNVRDRAPDPEAEAKRDREVRANLERLTHECGAEYNTVEHHPVLGTPRKIIPRYARRDDVELVILGRADKTAPLAGIMGSTAEEVAHATRCSLLIVPRHPDLEEGE